MNSMKAHINCPMCTRTVQGFVVPDVRRGRAHFRMASGQTCPRCHGVLDAGCVLELLLDHKQHVARRRRRAA